ncbi:MAG TPA: urease accessory protein UreD [Pseudomonadales bacterium]
MSTVAQGLGSVFLTADGEAVWRACLKLDCAGSEYGTRLLSSTHCGPLYVQKPFYPEGKDLAHIYPLHPPGGVVSGDELSINIVARDRAALLITTPGATRLYRARQAVKRTGVAALSATHTALDQKLNNHINVTGGSSVEWLPMETIVFNAAQTVAATRVDIDNSSRFLGWEVCCLGLPASNKAFESGRLSQRFEIYQNGKPMLIDKLSLRPHSPLMSAKCGLDNATVSGIFVAGPGEVDNQVMVEHKQAQVEDTLAAVREKIALLNLADKLSITYFNGFYLSRYLGHSAEQARKLFVEVWRILRPLLLNRDICPPRIWHT